MSDKDNELVDVPSHTTTWNLCIVAFELGFFVLGLSLKVLFGPHLSVQMGIVDEGQTFLCSFSVS